MPRRPVTDGGHTTFTDHRISKITPSESLPAAEEGADTLVAWHDPAPEFAQRDLGLAEVAVGKNLGLPDMAVKGARLLISAYPSLPKDAPILRGIGDVFYDLGRYDDAIAAYEAAIKFEPEVASNYLQAARALRGAKNDTDAIRYLEKTTEIDPMIQEAYGELAAIYAARNETDLVRQTWERFVKVFPNSIEARAQLRMAGDNRVSR
jgi:tetratricopeptide (TPR) repeat protein